jgi:hypothetical protein
MGKCGELDAQIDEQIREDERKVDLSATALDRFDRGGRFGEPGCSYA